MDSQRLKVSSPQKLVLRFISGKYQGAEFPLADSPEIIVGRSSDVDMVLIEDMVSRRHARLECIDEISIEDLGSTNGTFVNGERIKRAKLFEGDRVLIGTSIIKVVLADSTAVVLAPSSRRRSQKSSLSRNQVRGMAGSLDEIPLPDLLQLLGSSKKTGVLVLETDDHHGKIHLDKGTVIHAEIDELHLGPLKSAYRMLEWTRGAFELSAATDKAVEKPISVAVQEILMDGLTQLDELRAMQHKLPDKAGRLAIPNPIKPSLRDLTPNEVDVWQTIWNHADMDHVFDVSPLSDLETARTIVKLMEAGYVSVE
jgi:pSer/pThr/pTyr-binding forkhead associated (FHA) protein